ncbi:MAG: shikimate dehydrogenase [Ruminiclostridium sp.]|nr:shikimate dehydrogenase [Ruminiclostridium sp.]
MPELNIDGRTSLYALAGKYIGFSPIPGFLNTINSFMGYNSIMMPFDTNHYDIHMVLDALQILNCKGVYIDTPHRCNLDEVLYSQTEEARISGAVNVIRTDGKGYCGSNTEIKAFQKAFPMISGEELAGKEIFLIGAGGIARSIAVACAYESCKRLTIINRTQEKSKQLCERINERFGDVSMAADVNESETIHSFYNADIIINATSVGMFPDIDKHSLPENYNFLPHHLVFDVIYSPPQTKLIQLATNKCCRAVNGKDIMFYSCIEAFQWWTNVKIDEEAENKLFHLWKEMIYNI